MLKFLTTIKDGETIPDRPLTNHFDDKVIHMNTLEELLKTIERIQEEHDLNERNYADFLAEIEDGHNKYNQEKNDIQTRLSTAKRKFEERIEHAYPGHRLEIVKRAEK